MPRTPRQAVEELLAGIPESERGDFPMVETLESVVGKGAALLSLEESDPYFPKPETLVARGKGRVTLREAGAVLVDALVTSGHLKVHHVGDGVALVDACSIKQFLESMSETDENWVLTVDPVVEWINAHPEEVAKYRGKRVAIHPTEGIIASGETLEAVYEEARRLGRLDEVMFDFIPESAS